MSAKTLQINVCLNHRHIYRGVKQSVRVFGCYIVQKQLFPAKEKEQYFWFSVCFFFFVFFLVRFNTVACKFLI